MFLLFDDSKDAKELIVFKMVDICFASFVVVENDFESVASRHSRHETQIALVDIGDGAGTRTCVDFPSAISNFVVVDYVVVVDCVVVGDHVVIVVDCVVAIPQLIRAFSSASAVAGKRKVRIDEVDPVAFD